MKNYNYNLVKLLHNCLDHSWRIEKHYLDDAENLNCDCKELLEKIKSDTDNHIQLLTQEIQKHNLEE